MQVSASEHLKATAESLRSTIQNLPAEGWTRRSVAGGWCVAQVAEHIVIVETIVAERIEMLETAEGGPYDPEKSRQKDELVLQIATSEIKVAAPAAICPSDGEILQAVVVENFAAAHARLLDLAQRETAWLRGRFFPHPLFGKLDGYQWLVAASSHTVRHTRQIQRILEENR